MGQTTRMSQPRCEKGAPVRPRRTHLYRRNFAARSLAVIGFPWPRNASVPIVALVPEATGTIHSPGGNTNLPSQRSVSAALARTKERSRLRRFGHHASYRVAVAALVGQAEGAGHVYPGKSWHGQRKRSIVAASASRAPRETGGHALGVCTHSNALSTGGATWLPYWVHP